jgi:hypothetical protein
LVGWFCFMFVVVCFCGVRDKSQGLTHASQVLYD